MNFIALALINYENNIQFIHIYYYVFVHPKIHCMILTPTHTHARTLFFFLSAMPKQKKYRFQGECYIVYSPWHFNEYFNDNNNTATNNKK